MSRRREFSRKQRGQIICRATDPVSGLVKCEGCGLVLGRKPFEIDHTIPEELLTDKSRPLTIEDGKLLGKDCCHKPKTANDIRAIRKSDRVRDRNTGAMPKPKRRLPGHKDDFRKAKVGGGWVNRYTGEPL